MPIEHFDNMLGRLLDMQWEDFSDDTIKRAKWILTDTLFVAWYGCKSTELQNYIHAVGSEKIDAKNTMPIIGEKYSTTPYHQAVIHGTAIVSNELDEGNQFAKGHPAAHIFPPALIAAQENNASGKEFIRAFIIGYEVSARFAQASSMDDDMHPHGTWGMIGGTVAAGILQNKSTQALTEAVYLAASLPFSTSWQAAVTGMTVRNLYAGLSCWHAYHVLQLQSYGFKSSPHVVDHLWGSIMSDGIEDELFLAELLDPPMLEKNYFKFYSACRFSHPAIDGVYHLLRDNAVKPEEISSVEVETYHLAARLNSVNPKTALAAKFSIPFLISAILYGHSLYESDREPVFSDPDVRRMAEKIHVVEDPKLTALLPDKRTARVTIETKDGTARTSFVDKATGEYNAPFSENDMRKKINQMMSGYLNTQRIDEIIKRTLTLDQTEKMKDWLNFITEGQEVSQGDGK